jgi:hypothetical protein
MEPAGEAVLLSNVLDSTINALDSILSAYESKSFRNLDDALQSAYKVLGAAHRARRLVDSMRDKIKARDANGHFAQRNIRRVL